MVPKDLIVYFTTSAQIADSLIGLLFVRSLGRWLFRSNGPGPYSNPLPEVTTVR